MATKGVDRTIHATLCEIERGLFYVIYRLDGSGPKVPGLHTYQVGSSPSDAKQRIEENAKALGYKTIAWEATSVRSPELVSPHSPVGSVRRSTAAAEHGHR